MNDKSPVSTAESRRPDWLAGSSVWIEGVEDLSIHDAVQPQAGEDDESRLSPAETSGRNVWIEGEEDLSVRPLPAGVLFQADVSGG
ncbi:MAG: hypothetical protein KY476_01075 [Planctomycetes bacterium]|nr:hypothetical protein [Planctomycetota bacterium]